VPDANIIVCTNFISSWHVSTVDICLVVVTIAAQAVDGGEGSGLAIKHRLAE
jgi:hypothetical protein